MKTAVCLCILSFALAIEATQFTDCGSKSASVSKVTVNDCPDSSDTCILKKGTKVTLSIEFAAKSPSTNVNVVVHDIIYGVAMPFRVPNQDGCQKALKCPLDAGKTYTYTNELEVREFFPSIDVTVKWELKDEHNADIVCVEIPAEIQ